MAHKTKDSTKMMFSGPILTIIRLKTTHTHTSSENETHSFVTSACTL